MYLPDTFFLYNTPHPNANGTSNLYFSQAQFAYFDICILKRPGAEKSWPDDVLAEVEKLKATMTPEDDHNLVDTIIVKTQGFVSGNIKEGDEHPVELFRDLLSLYDGITADALRRKMPLMAYSPACGGALFRQDLSKEDLATVEVLREIQEELGAESLDEVLYAWLYRLPVTVVPVTGTGKKERVLRAVKALDYNMTREQWYDILRIARPPKNRDPKPEEQDMCIDWLRNQVKLIKPKIIVCLGRIAAAKIIKSDIKITKEHGIFFEKNGTLMTAMLHPAAVLRDPRRKPEAFDDFLKLREKINEICPETYDI